MNKCSAVAEMGDRLDTIDMGRKLGAVPFGGGGVGFHLTMWPGPRPTFLPIGILIHLAVWPQQTWAKIEGLCPFGGGRVGSPSNTVWPGPTPTSLPSGIHPAVWPQLTWTADYTDAGKACAPKFRLWGMLCHFPLGSWIPSNTVWPGPRPTCQVSS